MPKIFDRQLEDKRVKRMNEDRFFKLFQKELLWAVNTSEGRDFFCIDKKFPEIHEIAKNFIRHDSYVRVPYSREFPHGLKRVSTSEFRVGAKYANIIRYRWEEWQDLLSEYSVGLYLRTVPKQYVPEYAMIGGRVGVAYMTTSTFYPDPDVESTSVDGRSLNSAIDTFSNVRDAATGSFAQDNDSTATFAFATSLSGGFYIVQRDFFLFDTSSLPDTDTIDTGVISFSGTGTSPGDADNSSINIVSTTPASNTEITTADYDQAGSTVYASLDVTSWNATDGTYNDFTLDATGEGQITKTGVSKFGGRNSLDVGNSAPLGLNRVSIFYADQTGTTKDPKLVVTHTAVASFIPHFNIIF